MDRKKDLTKELIAFFQSGADAQIRVTAATPLLKWGILDSVRILELADFLQTRAGYRLKAAELRKENFQDVRSILRLIGARKPKRPSGR